jgi:hypothetical protein
MRRLVTGVEDGRSCVIEVIDWRPDESQPALQDFIRFSAHPPPARPPASSAFLDLALAPGEIRWVTSHFPPNSDWPEMHYTDTIDCHTIVAGSIDLILDDGPHRLVAGDCVIVMGVDHAWKAGPEGCTSSVLLIGTPPPEGA